jgi:NitT/TauT family transport system ATP-binding protein
MLVAANRVDHRPSGCGNLLRIMGDLQQPSAGLALIDGRPPREAQVRDIGFVFQDPSLLPWRTVTANVRLPREVNAALEPVSRAIS